MPAAGIGRWVANEHQEFAVNEMRAPAFRVLVVDDDASIRATYRHILQPPPSELGGLEALISGAGETDESENLFQVVEADQGETAVDLQRGALDQGVRYQIAFIDMRMPPGWDGMRTAIALRAQDPSIYIVIATAFSDYDVNALQHALEHDVVLLRKPFNQEEVYQLARTLCQSWETRQRLEAVTAEMESRVLARTAELDRRNALQSVLVEITTRFVEASAESDIDDAVNWSLARLGRAIDVDGAVLYRFNSEQDAYAHSHEWHALGVKPLPAAMRHISRAQVTPAHGRFLRGESFYMPQLADLPEEMTTLRIVLQGYYEQFLVVPLEIGGRLLGCLGVGLARSKTDLDPSGIETLLRTVGHAMARALDAHDASRILSQSQAMLARSESLTHIGSWEWDVATDTVKWSAEMFRIFRLPVQSAAPCFAEHARLYPPEDWQRLLEAVDLAVKQGTPYALQLRILRSDASTGFCLARGHAEMGAGFSPNQQAVRLYGSFQDITELKVTEDKLKKAQYIVSFTPDGIALLDKNYRYQIVNQTYERFSGLSHEAFIGRSIADYLGQDVFEQQVKPRFDRCLQGEIISYAEWFEFPTLGKRYVSMTYFPYRDEANQVQGVVANTRDITELKLAEAALADSEARYRNIVETAEEGIWQVDQDWKTLYVNHRMEALLGYPPGAMLGHSIDDFMDQAASVQAAALKSQREHGAREVHEFRLRRVDGGFLHTLMSTTPVFDADGKFAGATAMVTDITRRMQIEAALAATAEFVSRPGGEGYCAELVEHTAQTLDLDYVHIARLHADGRGVTTEAAWLDGHLIDNWSYELTHTPCVEVMFKARLCIQSGVQAAYPDDADLHQVGAESYVGEPVVDSSGRVLGLIVGISRTPITSTAMLQNNLRILAARAGAEWEQRAALSSLREERDFNRDILRNTEAIIVTLNPEGRITLINRKGCQLLGYDEAELLGQDWFTTCLPPNDQIDQIREIFQKSLANDLLGSEYYENPVLTRSGEQRLIAWHNSSVRDVEGKTIGGMSVGMDVTEQRWAEAHLLASEVRFHRLFDDTDALAIQGYLADGEVVFWNHASEKIYGYSAAEAVGGSLYDLIIPPPMRDAVRAGVRRCVENGEQIPSGRLLLKHKDGHLVPVYSSHTLVESPGQPKMVFCMDVDMSQLAEAEAALNVALTKYKTLFDCFPQGITVTDPVGKVLETNAAAEKLLGIPGDVHAQREIAGPEWQILRPDGSPMPAEEFASVRALKERRRIENVEKGVVRPDGGITWLSVTADLLPIEGYGLVITYSDITARRAAEEQIRLMAYYDPLTNLPNRRLLMDRLDQALIASKRSQAFGALLMLDLDYFKGLNDSCGHDVGDQLLIEVAHRLSSHVRQEDTVSRLGGDEYVVILHDLGTEPEAAAHQAMQVAEKIRSALSQPYQLGRDATPYASTVSIGVRLFHGQQEAVETLLKQVDVALYQAKDAGRNQVVFFQPG
jgi:diguanylate cyclase (GGDEF)-like protein/PAS domain S-box-containing protein